MTEEFKKNLTAACVGFLVISGLYALEQNVTNSIHMSNDIKKHYNQSEEKENVNVFNVGSLVTYEFGRYSHETFSSYIFPRSDMESEIPVPEGYIIKSYSIYKVQRDGKTNYVYNVNYINSKKVLVNGTYDYNLNSVIYDDFGTPIPEAKELELKNK